MLEAREVTSVRCKHFIAAFRAKLVVQVSRCWGFIVFADQLTG